MRYLELMKIQAAKDIEQMKQEAEEKKIRIEGARLKDERDTKKEDKR